MSIRRRRLWLVIAEVLFTSLICFTGLFYVNINFALEYNYITFGKHECPPRPPTASRSRTAIRKKLILFYTTIFERIPVFQPDRFECCEPFECEMTTDKTRLLESDAVIFHGRDLPRGHKMPTQRTPRQRWVFYTLENPYHSKIVPKEYNGIFNWTMTYERRADIWEPYGSFTEKKHTEYYKPKNYAISKNKLAVYVNSHCRTSERVRENYIRALSKAIKLDVYGKCAGIFGRLMCPLYSERCTKTLKQYKFYLSFENSLCEDYLTEKYWFSPQYIDAVPVVFGGKNLKSVIIPGSYIDAMDFPNAESLGQYLEYLDKNDTAYNQYFMWKRFYLTASLEPWPCRLCQMLHNSSLPVRTYEQFDAFLDPDLVCKREIDHFKQYLYY